MPILQWRIKSSSSSSLNLSTFSSTSKNKRKKIHTATKKKQQINSNSKEQKKEIVIPFTKQSAQKILKQAKSGKGSIVASGTAIDELLSKCGITTTNNDDKYENNGKKSSSPYHTLRNNLSYVTVIARASPQTKENVVSALKKYGNNNKVLMCGDGVNDVAAMKAADVGVSMLTGYNTDEEEYYDSNGQDESKRVSEYDVENERRRERLRQRRIGRYRRIHKSNTLSSLSSSSKSSFLGDEFAIAGIGDTPVATQVRVKRKIDKALKDIQQDSIQRQLGESGDNSTIIADDMMIEPYYQFTDIQKMISAFWNVFREERERYKILKKGGGAAARILAEEDKLRRSILSKTKLGSDSNNFDSMSLLTDEELKFEEGSNEDVENNGNDSNSNINFMIKPGEACLASDFTSLRPCIDGVDALIRSGIAAAASSLCLHQSIALNSLMSCYNLATLYKDGFRYGKYMWNVELAFISFVSQASYAASCMPRPRIGAVRSPQSVFHPSSAVSTFLQAIVHLVTLSMGVNMANHLESTYPLKVARKGFHVRWKDMVKDGSNSLSSQKSNAASLLINTLPESFLLSSSEEEEKGGGGRMGIMKLLGRPPFHPNYVTNAVFLISVFQNAVITLVNHKGRPFYGSVLESRSFCLGIGAAIAFCVACIVETFPMMNQVLELAPFPSQYSKVKMLMLLLADVVCAFLVDRLSIFFLHHELWIEQMCTLPSSSTGYDTLSDAADEEELVLKEESKGNCLILFVMALTIFKFIFDRVI